MKLEPGKYYKNRAGNKVYCIGINPFAKEDKMVICKDEDSYGCIENGSYYGDDEISRLDIISEWHEPKKVRVHGWMNVYSEDSLMLHSTKEVADEYAKYSVNIRIACLEIDKECTEGEGLE